MPRRSVLWRKGVRRMNYRMLIVIASWSIKTKLLECLSEQGCKMIRIVHGEGTYRKSGGLLDWIPRTNPEKLVVFSMCKQSYLPGVYKRLNKKFGFDKPDTGIAFSVDITVSN